LDAERLKAVVRERLGRRVVSIEGIAAGLGTRRFLRLHFGEGEPRSLIARCEPDQAGSRADLTPAIAPAPSTAPRTATPPGIVLPAAPTWLPEPALEPLRGFLEQSGVRVPHSFGHFPELGLDLLEDVGSRSLLRADRAERTPLYREACALVVRLQSLSAPPEQIPAFGRVYDRTLVDSKRWKWIHWAIPALLRRDATPAEVHELGALFDAIADLLDAAPRRLAHRDFKAENLHLLPAPSGTSHLPELVLIDVQGAFVAPPEYDLVCLLCDLQTDVDEGLALRLFTETLPALPDRPSPELARLRFDAIAISRLCKDVSHVIHAGVVRGDRRRWHEIPRGLELLRRSTERLEGRFPGVATLNSVIHALTTAVGPTDIGGEGNSS
jgi:aminoglycoside/choline kinase family phosphotransferase